MEKQVDTNKDIYLNVGTTIDLYGSKAKVQKNDSEFLPKFRIVFGITSIHVPVEVLNYVVLEAVTALYDSGDLEMAVAEKINYLSHVVLQDPREALEAAMMEAGEDF